MSYLAELDPEGEVAPITIDWNLAFADAVTKKGLAYWQGLRGSRTMPPRRDLRPRAMQDYLDHVNLVDVIAETQARFEYAVSLQGARARYVFGHMVGQRLGDMFPAWQEERWRKTFDAPRESRAPVRVLARASTFGKKWLVCESLLAPLGDGASVQAIFWVFACWNDR